MTHLGESYPFKAHFIAQVQFDTASVSVDVFVMEDHFIAKFAELLDG